MQLYLSSPELLSVAQYVHFASDSGGDGGGMFSIVILLMIPLAMYFLLIRPNRRRRHQQEQLQKSIDVGDEVMTNSGIYGFITGIEEGSNILWLEIDDDVQVRVSRAAISGKVDTSPDAGSDDGDDSADGGDDAAADDVAADESTTAEEAATGRGTSGGRSRRGRPSLKGASGGNEQAKPGAE